MTPSIIIVNRDIRYRTGLKEYLEECGFENVRVSDALPTDSELCGGNIIIARGDTLNYSDLLSVSNIFVTRFVLTYDGALTHADIGLAKCAHCVRGTDNFEYICDVVKEEISDYFTEYRHETCADSFLTDMLDSLGFDSSYKGYGYIVCAAGEAAGEMITKDVYPDIAKRYKTTASAVERSIRSSIFAAWCRGGLERFGRYIGWKSTKRPTNGEFISALVSLKRLEEMKL